MNFAFFDNIWVLLAQVHVFIFFVKNHYLILGLKSINAVGDPISLSDIEK